MSVVVKIIWVLLGIALALSVINGQWATAFVTLATLFLTFTPYLFQRRYKIYIPNGFIAAITIFIFATLFLGEVGDFYERFWWWDVALHTGSAIGFGLIGFVTLYLLYQRPEIKLQPGPLTFFAFTFAVAIGALWEIFEFTMDQLFGLNIVDKNQALRIPCGI